MKVIDCQYQPVTLHIGTCFCNIKELHENMYWKLNPRHRFSATRPHLATGALPTPRKPVKNPDDPTQAPICRLCNAAALRGRG
ncbi:MAG: hypothetical protein H7244_10615 [Herminiimonas sp.]|nr:hypothetical protein [Herminiimonas sp.]